MELDLPADVLLLIFNLVCPAKKAASLIYVKKIICLGTVNRQFKRVEDIFWHQIAIIDCPIIRSRLKLSSHKGKAKELHLQHCFACTHCQSLSALTCNRCASHLCNKCAENNGVECECLMGSCRICHDCLEECKMCGSKVCGQCWKQCNPCGENCCSLCYEGEVDCSACYHSTCKHCLELIECECKGPKYICQDKYSCYLDETKCVQCNKPICTDCGRTCQNCSHRVCFNCSKEAGKWYACKNECVGNGLIYTTCYNCEQLFVYSNKNIDVGHCGNCEPVLSENIKFCTTCVDTCQKCRRKLCVWCLNFHEPLCQGNVKCHKCQKIVRNESYHWCNCGRESGCSDCAPQCTMCRSRFCLFCVKALTARDNYDWRTNSHQIVINYWCRPCEEYDEND